MSDIISVGERPIQNQYRVNVSKDLCEAHGISPGDRVEVWIKKVETLNKQKRKP